MFQPFEYPSGTSSDFKKTFNSEATEMIFPLDPTIVTYGKVLSLEQNWGMFSPYILKDDGWFVYSGYHKTKGKYIDLKNNKDFVSFTKPTPVINEFDSDRWRKFQENYTFNNNNYMRPFYCKYLINTWNKKHPKDTMSDLTIFFIEYFFHRMPWPHRPSA